jgi:hypothetical protein
VKVRHERGGMMLPKPLSPYALFAPILTTAVSPSDMPTRASSHPAMTCPRPIGNLKGVPAACAREDAAFSMQVCGRGEACSTSVYSSRREKWMLQKALTLDESNKG